MKHATLALALILIAGPAYSWGEKGHYLVNEAAVRALPTDMPHFFLRSFGELVWLGYQPDRWKGAGDSLDAINEPDHFLDAEFTAGLELPRERYEFLELMEREGRFRRFGIQNSTTGFLPWRMTEVAERLTNDFRLWRATQPGTPERRAAEIAVIQTAGILGHYAGDSANPHHATIHYNGWAAAPRPAGFAYDCDTHSRFETGFVSRWIEIAEVEKRMAPMELRGDLFETALAQIDESNALVTKLYTLDANGAFAPSARSADSAGVDFAASRLADGASLLRDLWWSAWKNSEQRRPARRR